MLVSKKMASVDVFELPVNSSSRVSSMPARPRKRKRKPELWKKNVAKSKRARGKSYISPSNGKVVASAKPSPPCLFWELNDKAVQDAYLYGLIRVKKVGRCRPRKCESASSHREATYVYVVSNNIT